MKPVDRERGWQGAGIQFLILFAIAAVVRGTQPKIEASTDALVAFYETIDGPTGPAAARRPRTR